MKIKTFFTAASIATSITCGGIAAYDMHKLVHMPPEIKTIEALEAVLDNMDEENTPLFEAATKYPLLRKNTQRTYDELLAKPDIAQTHCDYHTRTTRYTLMLIALSPAAMYLMLRFQKST